MDLTRCDHVREVAERLCTEDCRWYHGSWELLRSLGVVSTSGVHARELGELLGRALADCPDRPALLLSGSTDDTLLRILRSSAGERELAITALDVCATPLALMGEYGAQQGLQLSCVQADILEYAPAGSFDLILTHAFMGYFDAPGRQRLVRKWSSLLGRNGRLATVQRVRAADAPAVVTFSPQQSADFVRAALHAAAQAGDPRPEFRARVEAAARRFAARFRSHSITSKPEFERLFVDAGLRIQHLEYRTLAAASGLSGPSVPSGGEYAVILVGR